MTDMRPEVLFVCVHNAGRSQMAAALLAHHAGGQVVVRSAGSAPADDINPASDRGHGRSRHRPARRWRSPQEARRHRRACVGRGHHHGLW
jgi:hypothetical protein